MATQRDYGRLSPSYRKRIDRTIGRAAYERGDNLKAARGHKASEGHRNTQTIKAIVRDGNTSRVVTIKGTTKAERTNIARHWNYVGAYINGQKSIDYLENRMRKFDGKRAGIVGKNKLRLETRPEGFEMLAFRHELDFDSIYVESGDWTEKIAA